jgi:hypothetical protein
VKNRNKTMGSIITIGKTSLNIAEVKCFEKKDTYTVSVELKEHCTYLQNPESCEYERVKHNDTIEFYFCEKEECDKFVVELKKIWQEYLDGGNQKNNS